MRVLLTGAESAKALVVARALGQHGYQVFTLGASRYAPVAFSRYCAQHITASDREDEQAFIDQVAQVVLEKKIDILLPTHSTDTNLILKYRDQLDALCSVPFVDYAKYELVNDKGKLSAYARELGLRIPQTWTFGSIEALHHGLDEISFPAVVKLRNGSGTKGLAYVNTRDDLVREFVARISTYSLTPELFPVIQEFIPGRGFGTSVLYDRGRPKAIFTHERLREYPSSGGSSTLRRSIRNEGMEAVAVRLLDAIEWHGLAMVEFKLHDRTQEPVLIEVNPRMWGSIYTAIVCGVNFPVLLCNVALGRSFPAVTCYPLGITTRFLLLDLLTFPGYARRSTSRLQLMKSYLSLAPDFDIEDRGDFRASCAYYLYKCFGDRRLAS